MPSPPQPPTGAPPRTPDVAAFLAAVRRAGIVTESRFDRVEAAVPPAVATPQEAARALIAAGLLTRFQAERLLAGRTDGFILGPYLILEQVGSGVMGRVYKARHQTMNRVVAVKVLAAELTRSPSARQRLQEEARVAARLNHRNIVTTFDANELAGRFYIVREYVDGPNLEALVRERGPLPLPEACELTRQLAEALLHAHGLGTVHGDVRPGNLLVTRPSKTSPELLLKLADFGFASFRPSLAPPAPGTPAELADFLAPEALTRPTAADHRADLYSLGAVLYFLLTGQPPFPGGNAEEKVRRHLWELPVRVEARRPEVPPALAELVHQLLAKHPAQRPQSAAEVLDRLDSLGLATADAITFDLPAHFAGPYSFVGGQLSGSYATAGGMVHPGHSPATAHTGYPSGYPIMVPGPVAGTSPIPWASPGAMTAAGTTASTPPTGGTASAPVPGSVAVPSPWNEITAETDALETLVVPTRTRSRAARSRSTGGIPLGVVAAIVLAAVAVLVLAVRMIGP